MNNLPKALEKSLERVAQEIKSEYERHAVPIRETGDFLNKIELRRFVGVLDGDELREFLHGDGDVTVCVIESRVSYDDVIERGRKDRPNYKPKYPALAAVEVVDARDLVDRITADELSKWLRG